MKTSLKANVAIACLLPVLCAFSPTAGAIRIGTLDATDQYSGVGMILPTAGHALCTGTMLSHSVFLTAAQCMLDSTTPYQFNVGPGLTADVTEIRLHPQANTVDGFNLAFDVALVALDETDLAGWSGVGQWAIRQLLTPTGVLATAVGFGETQTGAGSGERRSGSLLITQYIGGEGPIGNFFSDGFIETVPGDAQNQMFCPGDVGGPLIYGNQIAGVASFRFVETCDEEGPGYYVSLSRLSDWIGTNLIELDPTAAAPEPSSALLLGLALAGMLGSRRKRITR